MMNAIIDQQKQIEILKNHFPRCAAIFDQIIDTKKSEQEYKDKYPKKQIRGSSMLVDQSREYIIFDIDGTLADISHRLHHIKEEKEDVRGENGSWKGQIVVQRPDWQAFNNDMVHDTLNRHIAAIYGSMCPPHHSRGSIVVTGRPETHRKQTEKWLRDNLIFPDYLFMRPAGDYRSDVDVKRDIVKNNISDAKVLLVIDDRSKVVEMWRELGYHCLQCQKGDY